MAESCAIIPRVKNNKGQVVDSKLFEDLLSFTNNNRADSKRCYLITKSNEFIEKWNPKLVLDDNNEPTISSLLKKTNFADIISESKVLERLNKDIGHYKKGTKEIALEPNNSENYQKLAKKVIFFNNNSEFKEDYVARIVKTSDKNSPKILLGVTVEKRNKLNSIEANKLEYNETLNSKLRDILKSHGIKIGALTDLEERRGVNGVTDFDAAKDAASGIIELIRLAKGIQGEKALPEEFAHFVIEALGDHPLVTRLLNIINSNDLTKEILGEDYDIYDSLYHGDKVKLAKEVAGKLLAQHLLQHEEITPKPYRNVLQRLIEAIKGFFKELNADSIQKAMNQANKEFGNLAAQVLNGELDADININNIGNSGLFYSTTERVSRDKALLQDIIKNELKRYDIYIKRSSNENFDAAQQELINELQAKLGANNEIEGIYTFIENALDRMSQLNKRLALLQSTPGTTLNEKASILRDVRNYLYSYKHIMDDIREALLDEEKYSDNRYGQRVRVALDNTSRLLDDLFIQYKKEAIPLLVDFIKPFLGDSLNIAVGKWKGVQLTPEDIIAGVKRDKKGNIIWYQKEISIFDRWLDSAADSSDYMVRILDHAIKMSKENARLDTINLEKEISAATIKLEQAGVSNTSWMYERDSKGNLTGNYISETNWGLYKEKRKEMLASLKEKYGNAPIGESAEKYKEERQSWYNNNMEIVDGKRIPKRSIYGNKDYQNLNTAQKEYYDKFMEIKSKLDSYLPESATKLLNTIKIRKDLLERVKASDSIKSGTKQIWEAVKDSVIRRSDDTEFGDKTTIKDFEGNEVQTLPIYYTNTKKGENPNDISTDAASTLIAYAAMANDFKEMNKVIDVLELSRDIIKEREIIQTSGNKVLVEKAKILGNKIESTLTKSGKESRNTQRLDDLFKMQVYRRFMEDEGTIGSSKIDKGKAANKINTITSINSIGLNILGGISNVSTGIVMMDIEAFSKEYFNSSNTFNADKHYGAALPEYLAEVGNRVKVSKLALWDEFFNVMQEYDIEIKEKNFDRKTWFSRMFGTKALFMINNAGEHWMQNRTSLALADAYKMKAPDGKIVSLWDAMEVVPIDKNNKKLGAKLQLKQGYTKEDGSAFTRADSIAFGRKATAINQRMHGIYNEADKSAIQRLAIGRMGLLFRKYIKPSLNRRFKSGNYNYDLQDWTEGYYIPTFKFLGQLAKELKEGQFNLVANWNQLSKKDKVNIKRAMVEVSHFLIIAAILGLIDWPDDKDRPWLVKMTEYQIRRLYTEIGVLVPGPQMIGEGLKIMKSPAAGVNTLENLLDLIGTINPYNYETFNGEDALVKSGRYKGSSKAMKIIYNSPLIPMNKTIYKGLYPEEAIPFYKQ